MHGSRHRGERGPKGGHQGIRGGGATQKREREGTQEGEGQGEAMQEREREGVQERVRDGGGGDSAQERVCRGHGVGGGGCEREGVGGPTPHSPTAQPNHHLG